MNRKGEEPGLGPEWSCEDYGKEGHDYMRCPDCWSQFETFIANRAALIATGNLPLD
ncbi:hypothetical protein L4X63_09430 [Geomonas sp. Red32]|uniref:hypothetical protein n=1 Tax=Geomonas sp. Red32 TaxID=2912856 RepID=UPI00202CD1E1|nr:hypothetical protein [Geomonas sp. Red32]MCM0081809.1 hypothetical protein [Geomonas sp. Red32]